MTSMFEGDEFGKVKTEPATKQGISARQCNAIHEKSDVNTGPRSQHHYLGSSRNDAATGSHIHTGKDSLKLGSGLSITISGSRGGNAALASLIAALKQVMDLTDNTTA